MHVLSIWLQKNRWHTFAQYIHLVIGQLFYAYHKNLLDPANNVEISAGEPDTSTVCHLDRVFLNNIPRASLGERGKGSTRGRMWCTTDIVKDNVGLTRMTSFSFSSTFEWHNSPRFEFKTQCTTIRANPESDRDGGVHCISPQHPRFDSLISWQKWTSL